MAEERLEAVYVAELRDGTLVPAGQVEFGLAGKGFLPGLDRLRDGLPSRLRAGAARAPGHGEVLRALPRRGWIREGCC